MKFLKNVMNKKVGESQNLNFSEEDIDLLAVLCERCIPIMARGIILRKTYSYYFLTDEANIEIAKYAFEKNGLVVSRLTHEEGGYVEQFLRIEHKDRKHSELVAGLMRSIRERKQKLASDFYNRKDVTTWWKVQDCINSIKNNQRQLNTRLK